MINTLITIGPRTLNKEDISEFKKHSKLFRLNGSHNTIAWHSGAIKLIREQCPEAFILIDIPGIKPRTANTENILIEKGQEVCFGDGANTSGILNVRLTKTLPNYDNSLENFSVNDGQYLFDVSNIGTGFIEGISREKFQLLPKKGINIPNSIYDEEMQFSIYKKFITQIKDLDIDALGLSFVQTGELVTKIRSLRSDLVLISKIENSEGLKNCNEISTAADAVMIDRGDLVAEIGYQNLYAGIETISRMAKAQGKPLIMATENLETMINRELPSKSEVVSLSHSAHLGVDCFMLSEETAVSEKAQTTVRWLADFLNNLPIIKHIPQDEIIKHDNNLDIWSGVQTYSGLPALIMSKSGRAISRYLALQPNTELFLMTNSERVLKSSLLYSRKVTPIKVEMHDVPNIELLWEMIDMYKKEIFREYDKIVAIYVSKYVKTPRANTITIFNKSDFY